MSVEGDSRTLCFLRGLRRAEGGFADRPGESAAGLQHTVSVLKALLLVQAGPDDPAGALAFVESCAGGDGGFADVPGGEPTAYHTAFGLIALRELGAWEALERRAPAGVEFMATHAASAPDHFMTVAAFEECGLPGPVPPATLAFFRGQRRDDGSFGDGVLANALAYSALRRAGQEVDRPDRVAGILLASQRDDGGFAGDAGPSDLNLTYAVMRALDLLGAAPDLDRLEKYVASLRTGDGAFAEAPGGPAGAGATYRALGILRWAGRLAPLQPVVDAAGAVRAARRGDVAPLARWLGDGGDPDQRDAEGWTPLLAAAVRGQAGAVELLLFHDIAGARRASPEVRLQAADALPVYMAGQSGDLETVKLLLRARPQHLFEISEVNGHTVLLQAAFFGSRRHEELARYLLENVGEILCIPEGDVAAVQDARRRLLVATNVRGYNALAMAGLWQNDAMGALFRRFDDTREAERKEYLRRLLERIAPPAATDERELAARGLADRLVGVIQDGFAMMAGASSASAAAVRRVVLEAVRGVAETPGFDVDHPGGPLQQPPLVVAATGTDGTEHVARLRDDLVALLLERGADPDREEKHPMGVDAVIRAAVLNHLYVLKRLGAAMDPEAFAAAMNARPAVNGQTALQDAVHRALTAPRSRLPGHLEQIRWMVAHGARADVEDHVGVTPEGLARSGLADPVYRQNAPATLRALGLEGASAPPDTLSSE
ncbi:MAG TPA: ankyrin repeat domain-containing protein [Longimicrobiaceae bacterium]|nr:ankyrin repeat domain-containing protein [Longimicrobiaceae bacterium]